jgi:hypothetical protein
MNHAFNNPLPSILHAKFIYRAKSNCLQIDFSLNLESYNENERGPFSILALFFLGATLALIAAVMLFWKPTPVDTLRE